jgi:tartrate-resistant acid phosphatase type 5
VPKKHHLLLIFLLAALLGAAACSGNNTPPPMPGVATSTATPFASASFTPIPPTVTFTPSPTPASFTPATVHFAVIGDFGRAGEAEAAVAALVHSWHPDFILSVGDNNYPVGGADTMQKNVLQYYGNDIASGHFFPTLGNHDWGTGNIKAYLQYLHPLGNGRYYQFARGPVRIFVLDSDYHEPDGAVPDSKQVHWLKKALAAATEPWKIVAFHHPPYSSGPHGSTERMRWPFAQWGATAVITGHDHDYERIMRDGIVYIVDGLGGVSRYEFPNKPPVEGSAIRYNANYGALKVDANAHHLTFQFITIDGKVIDTYTISP